MRTDEAAMMNLHTEILKRDGKKQFAVLPYEEFEKLRQMAEDYDDLNALRNAKKSDSKKKGFSTKEARKSLGL